LVAGWIPIATLVPDADQKWRPLVQDAFQFVFSHLSKPRLAVKIGEQLALPPDTPPERRLIQLVSRMPGLQKIGQVLARNRHITPALRTALTGLENGMSDVSISEIKTILHEQLGERLEKYQVQIANRILSEASVSAVIRFTWRNPHREREQGVFKVLKPFVPECYAEDMALLQSLGEFLASRETAYGFAIHDVHEMLTEVRLVLERELDFVREQATLVEAVGTYRATIGLRVPRVIQPLCTPTITAMSHETGVKVTDAFPRSPIRRERIAWQLIEALIAVPLFSGRESSVFHADPHAGNLLYDESNRELIVLDWALAERLSLKSRRGLILLAVMMILRNREGVRTAIRGLRSRGSETLIDQAVDRFFRELPEGAAPGILEAMQLLDRIAMLGVHFAAPLFLFRKSLFTLDGVLQDVVGSRVRMDTVIARHYFTRWAASFGLLYSPLALKDFLSLEWNALLYPARRWGCRSAAS
jgi:ubiquinone biosynthesis protein